VNPHAAVRLLLLWHQHQPDYRHPRDGVAQLPWVRLHATKDYLDMVRRLEPFPRVRATFNFVPILLDQLDDAANGGRDALFERLPQPVETLDAADRREVAERCSLAPRWALERWPAYAALTRRVAARDALRDDELLALECSFLLAWLDPSLHGEPEAVAALAAAAGGVGERDGLLALYRRVAGQVVPAHRARADAGQIELSTSPYCHPILPLLVDTRHARRANPSLAMPAEAFVAPEDAAAQIERAISRHRDAFGAAPRGMWPSEGSVSPEAVGLAARAGLEWLASDEGVLWASLPQDRRTRDRLYRPWKLATPDGDVALFFRDHELSDRIGFVYARWNSEDAVADFMERLRRIGREHGGDGSPLVSVILDGENCWENYASDGGPFLDRLYTALAMADDIETVTPGQVLDEGPAPEVLPELHSGSWIDADFHIWIGHPEKNRAWELLVRARRTLIEGGATPETQPRAWRALHAAEGSDWFWWFGDDHHTDDRALFDLIFREHLQAVYEHSGAASPAALRQPIVGLRASVAGRAPIGYVTPQLDGRRTGYYEWHAAGSWLVGSGGSMHHDGAWTREVLYGFDEARLYLRADPLDRAAVPRSVVVEALAPRASRWTFSAESGGRARAIGPDGAAGDHAEAAIGAIVEIALPFAALGVAPGERLDLLLHVTLADGSDVVVPADGTLSLIVPGPDFAARVWSA